MENWQSDWARSFDDQQRRRRREYRMEIAAIVACYLLAIGGASGLFIYLSTH